MVLLNSIGTDMDLWAETLPLLRPHFRPLRIDTRGHGASEATPGDYNLGMLAGDILAVMDDAGIDRAHVAGVSLGGMIAMELAQSHAHRVDGLALVGTSATMDRQAWSDRVAAVRDGGMASIADLAMERFLSLEYRVTHPDVAATVRHGLETMASNGYAGCAAAIRDMALRDGLATIAAPTLVVTGMRDTSTPFAGHGDILSDEIPGARAEAIDAAHLAPLEAPAALAELLIAHFGPFPEAGRNGLAGAIASP